MKFGRTIALTAVLLGSTIAVVPPARAQQEVDPTYYPPVAEQTAPPRQHAVVAPKGKASVIPMVYHPHELKPIAKKQPAAVNGHVKPPARK
jgi:hypothetical protein